jgi:SRSO17 transposase
MRPLLEGGGRGRLTEFLGRIGDILGHDRRRASFATYALGLLSNAERKSLEPIAAQSCPVVEQVSAVHQQLHHFVTDSRWSDREVRLASARHAIKALTAREPIETWQVDDTGFLKQGIHSVGMQRQYTGTAGKITNCQIGVSLTVATQTEQLPIDFELYLPKSWTESKERREEAQIPEEVTFKTKIEQAREMIDRAVAAGIPRGVVLADAFYGDEPSFRRAVRSHGLQYAVGIKSDNRVWQLDRRGRRAGAPLTVGQLARSLDPQCFRRFVWRQGTGSPLAASFAMLRVIPAFHSADDDIALREKVWLICERRDGEREIRFSFASLPSSWSQKRLVRLLKQRWRTERVYQDLKGELGLDHYEGRRYSGWHHHVSVALCCHAFVVAERARRFSPPPRGSKAHRALTGSA